MNTSPLRTPGSVCSPALSVFLCLSSTVILEADFSNDLQIWPEFQISEYSGDQLDLTFTAEARVAESGHEVHRWRLTQHAKYAFSEHLDLGFAYSFIEGRGDDSDPWNRAHRLEFEALPHFNLGNRLNVALRSRYQLVYREGRGDETFPVFRQRILFSRPAKWLPRMNAFSAGNEFFYDMDRERMNQNRFYPAMLHFQVNEKSRLTAYYMVWSRRQSGDEWIHAHVIGMKVRWNPFR